MGCCDKDKNDPKSTTIRDYPEGIDGCCHVRGRRCFCLPYDDPWMITAQILSIVAVFISWIWWASWIVSIVGMVLLQVVWCCRQTRGTLVVSAAVAISSAVASVGVGIWVLVVWARYTRCEPLALYAWSYDDDIDEYYWSGKHDDRCYEGRWAAISFVCGVLWMGIAFCILKFLLGGRHAKWEEKHGAPVATNASDNAVVELGAVPVATAAGAPAEAAAVTVIAAVSEKVDDAV
jgi:hypothetical protein